MSPRLSCLVVVDLSAPDDYGLLNIRGGLRSHPPVPSGARVRLQVGSARAVSDVYLHQLVQHLRPAASVEIEAHDGDFAMQLHAVLRKAFTSERYGVLTS
jgi:hypothetical protein